MDEDEAGVGGSVQDCCCVVCWRNRLGLLNEPPDELDTDEVGDTLELVVAEFVASLINVTKKE